MSVSIFGIPNVLHKSTLRAGAPSQGATSAPVDPAQRTRALLGTVLMHLFNAAITLTGFGVLAACLEACFSGEAQGAGALLGAFLGAVFAAVGLGFFYSAHIAAPAREARTALHAHEPWMLRADWAARKVVDRSSLAVMIFLWIWSAGWCGASALIWTVNRNQIVAAIHDSWWDAALASLMPLAGIIGLIAALKVTRTWWRYGASTLAIDTLPGFLGDAFRGRVTARLAKLPSRPLQVEIACERRTWREVRDSDGHWSKEWSTVPVWSKTYLVEPGRVMRAKDGVLIPIDVPLPADQPGCALDDAGAGIVWSLHVRAEEPGMPRFTAHFAVPVYARH